MALADRLAEAGTIAVRTPWRVVDLHDEAACAEAVRWWEHLTTAGGKGMVVKPRPFIARGAKGLVQLALKVRGREYLRIIYGPEYDALERLRERPSAASATWRCGSSRSGTRR